MKVASYGLTLGFLVLATVSSVTVSSVTAQDFPFPFYAMGSNNYHHASTVEEGAQRGLADVIRSSGAANLMNSQAAINVEEARSKYIQNRLQATQTYFDMKRVNRQYRQETRPQPATQQQLIRFAQDRLPDRLNASQLDPLTGALKWPLILRSPQFAMDRQQVEELFAKRASDGYLSPDQFLQARNVVEKMKADLRSVAGQFPGNMQIEALRFLQSLNFEAGFQT